MTQSSPPNKRTSTRIRSQQQAVATNKVTKPTSNSSLIRHMKKKVELAKGSIIGIRDFKKASGTTMYLVQRDSPAEDVWETEDTIDRMDILTDYQQKVLTESGYAITNDQQQSRPSRTSKTRAVIALRRMEEDDGEISTSNTRSKSIKSNRGTRKPATKNSSMRKTKAQLLQETQEQERLTRQQERQKQDPNAIIRQLHVDGDCCLQCSINKYRETLENDDLDGLKQILNTSDLPHYSQEDKPNGLSFIEYAIVLQREKFADTMSEYNRKPRATPLPQVPAKYTRYDGGDTGHNHRVGEYFRRSFRKVEEARGNRIGNSAFYRQQDTSTPKQTFMNVEDLMRNTELRQFMPFISKPAFQDPKVIENYLVHFETGSCDFYFAAASGNRRFARAILDDVNRTGRSTFNHLHEEVLKFERNQNLTSYRKPQILKMASDASNVSPYHVSALNPSAKYLAEFYEALDPAERLETDAFGRSVAFYAAVSETSTCLEFLESKNYNLSLIDKFKLSPLMQAARFGRAHNVELLIKHFRGPNVDATPPSVFQSLVRNRRTALHYAAYFGHAETCRVLIQYDVPVDAIENLEKQTALHYAAKNGYIDCVQVLIEQGHANPEKGDKFARTALHYACMFGHLDVVKYLLSKGVNADATDSSNNCPAHFAAAFGYIKILHLLIEYGNADPSICNVWRGTPCSVANMKGHLGIVKYLLGLQRISIDVNFKDQEGMVMLQLCIEEDVANASEIKINLDKARVLLSMHADPNSVNLEGNSSLHTLVSNTTYSRFLPKDWESFYPIETHNQAKVEFDDMEGIAYHTELAQLLLQHQADLNLQNAIKETPLASAMRYENSTMVALLIDSGAQFWIDQDHEGNNVFHYFGKLVSMTNSLQPHTEMDEQVKARHVAVIERIWKAIGRHSVGLEADLKKLLNKKNDTGRTPLINAVYWAVEYQRTAMVREKKLIHTAVTNNSGKNASTTATFGFGKPTPSPRFRQKTGLVSVNLCFDFTVWIEHMNKCVNAFKPDMDQVVSLPKNFKKEKPNAKKSDYPALTGYTALHIAAQTQCVDIIQFLLKSGCNPNIPVKLEDDMLSGDTPIILAYDHKKDLNQEVRDTTLESIEQVKKDFIVTKPDFTVMLNSTMQCLLQFKACPYILNVSGKSALLEAAESMDVVNLEAMCQVKPSTDTDINTANELGETALMVAVESIDSLLGAGKTLDVSVVKALLDAGADLNAQYEDGDTVLMRVIKTSHGPLLETFLDHTRVFINNDLQNKKYETAIMIACMSHVPHIILTYIQYLKKTSCNLNVFDGQKATALSYAAKLCTYEVVHALLKLGANPNFNSSQHIPLIECIVHNNDLQITAALLSHGADMHAQDDAGNTALHAAVVAEKGRVIQVLLDRGADFEMMNARKQTPLHLAVETTAKKQTYRSFAGERLLVKAGANVNAKDIFGRTPLHYVFVDSNLVPITRNTAVIKKKVKQISEEMKAEKEKGKSWTSFAKRFDLNEFVDDSGDYLSLWMKQAQSMQLKQAEAEKLAKKAREKNHDEETVVVLDEERDMLKVYYRSGWEVDEVNSIKADPIDILRYLFKFENMKFDVKDDFGRTPLHYAACVGAFSCTSMLIEKKVDINATDNDNNTAVQLALRNNYVDYSVMLCNMGATVHNEMMLKDGHAKSTFGFCLSQSLINMAYLIMDRGVALIESIRDALKSGKYHIVETLLQLAENEVLAQILPDGQNIWHIIAGFKPFDNVIWDEFVEGIIERLVSLNVAISKDKAGRTPLHYAAKYGQASLLKRFLAMPNVEINLVDENGCSEIDYAVGPVKFEAVKVLLNAGANTSNSGNAKKSSLILKAVTAQEFRMTKLLLQHGASPDEDSSFGRINAVMIACRESDVKLLNLLIEHKADVNKPSHVERKDKHGKRYTALVHPVFIASVAGSSLLKILLQAGANPNVCGPESKPEYGRSLFMYNVSRYSIESQKTLLEFNIDLNMVDTNSSRSIFYQFFFGRKKYGYKYVDNEHNRNLTFDEKVYETMIQSNHPEVNHVDKLTGMTPLELAICEDNTIIVERLLTLGANINIESCNVSPDFFASTVLNPMRKKLPAMIHAVLHNNLKMVKLICEKTTHAINWLWHDDDKHTVVSYITGSVGKVSHQNESLLELVATQMGKTIFKKLLQMRDNHGKSPVYYAFHRSNKQLYDIMVSLEPSCVIDEDNHMEESEADQDISMETISVQSVDEDALKERELLQKEADIENAKTQQPKNKEDVVAKVDPYSKLEKIGVVMLDKDGKPYDIELFKVEIRGWGVYTDTSFYKLSIVHNRVLNLYILWTRWGSYGQEGQHQKTPFLSLDEAVSEFKSIFKAKTSNAWEDLAFFEHKLGRYDILKKSHHPKDTIIKNFDFMNSTTATALPQGLADLMKLICNFSYLSRVYTDSNIDMPMGQVSQKTIEKARQVLKDVVYMTKMRREAAKHYSNGAKLQEAKTWNLKIAQKCVEYARLLPRSDDLNQPIRSLYDNQDESIKREISRVDDLSYVNFAANVILAAKHNMHTIHPLEYAYNTLNCSLRTITTEAAEYQLVKNYMESTSAGNQELVHLIAVNRADEAVRFKPFEKEDNRKLLWHGSRVGNFMGILTQGLRASPRTSASNGAMLGNGVYFADTFSKSLGYATDYYGSNPSSYKLLLLCEVALGSKTDVYKPNFYGQVDYNSLDSMKGEGRNIPDPMNAVYDANGVCIPMGPCITAPVPITQTTTPHLFGSGSNNAPSLHHNEFAVYDESRVKIKYLLIVRDSTSCFLCAKSVHNPTVNLKVLHQHDVKKYDYGDFNNFEAEVTKAYLTHESKTPQDVFDAGLEHYIDSGSYKEKWNTPLNLTKESKVCSDCASFITAVLLEKKMTSSEVDIPESLQTKPQCKYGKECRTQNKIAHARKYQHWLKKNISDDATKTQTKQTASSLGRCRNRRYQKSTETVDEFDEDGNMDETESGDDEDSMDTDED